MRKPAFKRSACFAVSLIFFLLSASPAASAFEKDFTANYSQFVYNEENGLPDNFIDDILMTSDGEMWFASSSGLIEYDSKQFTLINSLTATGFGAMTARSLFEDSKGRLWIATSDGGVICRENNTYTTVNVQYGATSDSVNSILELPDGNIAVVTASGIFFVDDSYNVTLPQSDEAKSVKAFSAASDVTGRICGVTGNDEIFSYLNGTFTNYGECVGGGSCDLTSIVTGEDGIFYIGASDGRVFRITFGENGITCCSEEKSGIGSVNQLVFDNSGNLWVAAEAGVGYFTTDGVFHSVSGLSFSGHITAVSMDYQGNLWVGSDTYGVEKLCKSSVYSFNGAYSLSKVLTSCVIKIDGNTYIGTDSGLTIVNEESGETINNSLVKALYGISVTDVLKDQNGNIWVGTGSDGIIRQGRDGKITIYTKASSGIISNRIKRLYECKNGDIVIGTSEGISIIRDNNIYYTLSKANGFAGSVISFFESSNSILYVGTEDNGAYAVKTSGEMTAFSYSDGLESGKVSAIVLSQGGDSIWVAVGAKLLYVNIDGSVKEIKDLGVSKPITDILRAPDGKLWIATANNIIIADETELLSGDTTGIDRISSSQGLISNVSSGSHNYMSDDGILYLCCDDGIYTIDTTNYNIADEPPKILINKISTENEIITNTENISVSEKAGTLSFNISVLSYRSSESYKIQYYMDGMDKSPITVSADSVGTITYSNLVGGNYTFNICVVDENGQQVGNMTTVKVKKQSTLFEKASFKVSAFTMGFLTFIVLMYALIFLKARRAEIKRKQYMAITLQAVMSITKAIDAKDPYTKGHSERVARYSAEVAKRLKFKASRVEDLYYTALLHDIGKIGIPDEILKKPDSLTPEEYEIMKTHTTIGADILSGITAIKNVRLGALEHHEKYNGKGYPMGLKGNRISLEGRIIGAADAYDAMASCRDYSDSYETDRIIKEIENQSGEQFDPRIAQVIIDMIKDGYFDESHEP